MSKPDAGKRFLKLAYEQLNPKQDSVEGVEQALANWYCFQYNVPPNDDKLQEMTFEELMILHQMHRLRENPQLADEITTKGKESYEDWLKKEMGEGYVSLEDVEDPDDNFEAKMKEKRQQKEFEEQVKKDKEKYPEKIETDFDQFKSEE